MWTGTITRRRFINSVSTLLALSCTEISMACSVLEDLKLIEEKTFYLKEPIIIKIPGVTIKNCTFIAKADMHCMILICDSAIRCRLKNCAMLKNGYNIGSEICIEPQVGKMISLFQDCLDTLNGGGTLKLSKGQCFRI